MFFLKTGVVPLKVPASFACAVRTNGKDSDSTHSQSDRGGAHPQGQLWRWLLESDCVIQGNRLGAGGRGPEVSLCIRVVAVLCFHSSREYCSSTRYMPGRECSSPRHPWTNTQLPGVDLAPDTRHWVPAKPCPGELWRNSIGPGKWGNKEGVVCRSEGHVGSSSGKRQCEGVYADGW